MENSIKLAEKLAKQLSKDLPKIFENDAILKLTPEQRVKVNEAKIEINKVFQEKSLNLEKINQLKDELSSSFKNI
jgi:hypothetical protein